MARPAALALQARRTRASGLRVRLLFRELALILLLGGLQTAELRRQSHDPAVAGIVFGTLLAGHSYITGDFERFVLQVAELGDFLHESFDFGRGIGVPVLVTR